MKAYKRFFVDGVECFTTVDVKCDAAFGVTDKEENQLVQILGGLADDLDRLMIKKEVE